MRVARVARVSLALLVGGALVGCADSGAGGGGDRPLIEAPPIETPIGPIVRPPELPGTTDERPEIPPAVPPVSGGPDPVAARNGDGAPRGAVAHALERT